ncbi:MAG: P1 family peptidase [Syntrophobacteraceae bacterium]
MKNDTITEVGGLLVGHAELDGCPTGCTVILPDVCVAAGVDVRGGAPGTYGTDSLNPLNLVGKVNGFFFAGGSAFGLSTADGLRQCLYEKGLGFDSGHGRIPIVAGAIIFDLGVNRTGLFPGPELAGLACGNASALPVAEGSVGAGLGATVGKLFGFDRCMKGGVGSCCIHAGGGIKVGALMVVNAFGEIFDPSTGAKVAGARKSALSLELADSIPELLRKNSFRGFAEGEGTIVGVVATNAKMSKLQLTKIAQMTHDGLARAVSPVHTQYDGDTVFAVSCGSVEGAEVSLIGTLAAMAASEAIIRAVRKAEGVSGIPAATDLVQ